ncbi:hypothetical protein ACWDUN_26330 [Mycobacterium sp. NPDC003323]
MAVWNESVDRCREQHNVRLWLGAGALTLGMGAAMFGAAGVAAADSDTGSSSSTSSSGSDSSSSSDKDGASSSVAGSDDSPEDSDRDAATGPRTSSSTKDESDRTEPESFSRDDDSNTGDDDDSRIDSIEDSGTDDADTVDDVEISDVAPSEDAEFDVAITPAAEVLAESSPAVVSAKPISVSEHDLASVSRADDSAAVDSTGRDVEIVEDVPDGAGAGHSAAQQVSGLAGRVEPVVAATTAGAIPSALPNWGLPTPNQILRTLQQFGTDLYYTVAHQFQGMRRNLTVLRDDLVRMVGIRQIVVVDDAPYGNPAANLQYWAERGYSSHTLATAAMAWAQLTGTAVDVQSFLDIAAAADSLYADNQKVYVPGSDRFVNWTDAFEVLQGRGVRIFTHFYAQEQKSNALHALTAGLQDPTKAQMVVMDDEDGDSKAVVVIGVDTDAGTVTVNDPTSSTGRGATMNLDDFLSDWGAQNFRLVTAQLAATIGAPPSTPAATRTRWVWELPRPERLGQVLRNLGGMVAETVVNQIDGVQRNLVDLSDDLARTFGVANLIAPEPPAPGDVEFGDYTANKPYFIFQGDAQSCAIMASAGIIGQLTGVMPTQQQILEQAWNTPSDVISGEAIFEGDGDVPGKHWGTYTTDVLKLLNLNGVDADVTTFLKSQRQFAVETLNASLADKQGVIVSVNASVLLKAHENTFFHPERYRPPSHTLNSNHMVIVLSVNTTKNVVYINDSAWENGQGLPVPLDKFLDAWQTGGHTMVTAQLAGAAQRSVAV